MKRPEPIEIMIGYSFGISPTCEPGVLNERIAKRIAQDMNIIDCACFVGVQWELEDALQRIDPNRFRDSVVATPLFREDDFNDKVKLKELRDLVSKNKVLSDLLNSISLHPNLEDIFEFPNRAVSYLNRLLQDTALFRQFLGLPLDLLKKIKNGREWVESRMVPDAASPDLETYQARRLNRLILEFELKPVVPVAPYIATFHVADAVLKDVYHRGLTIGNIRVYGHPAHVERCKIQTIESAWKIGMCLDPSQVNAVTCGDHQLSAQNNWDPNNAQEWVQSWENWKQHEGI